jgi:hypothetical protein
LRENYEDLINDCGIIISKLISDQQNLKKVNPNPAGSESRIMESFKTTDPSLNGDIVLRISTPHDQFLNDIATQDISERPCIPFRNSFTGTVNSDSQVVNNSPDTSLNNMFSAPNLNDVNLGRFDTLADFELNGVAHKKVVEPTPKLRRASFAGMLSTPSDTDFEMSNAFRIIGDDNTKHDRPGRKSLTGSFSFKDDKPHNCGNVLSLHRDAQR